ncbi:MAG: rhodanese-like domain-containing protein [Gammaproteobacteria bacterium]|nr:rhodanese-like domain-containing protein [Gammaproteobacteria bacterium]
MADSLTVFSRVVALLLGLALISGPDLTDAELPAHDATVSQALLLDYLADNSTFTLIDARSPAEFATSHINGAINLPHDADSGEFSSLPDDRDAPIVVYCKTGKRAGILQQKLMDAGYTDVRVLQPTQIVWFDGMAVFNCGVDAVDTLAGSFDQQIIEGKRE